MDTQYSRLLAVNQPYLLCQSTYMEEQGLCIGIYIIIICNSGFLVGFTIFSMIR